MKIEDNDECWVTNRVKKTEPLSDKGSSCKGCDGNHIREGERCSVCGHRDKTKHRKP